MPPNLVGEDSNAKGPAFNKGRLEEWMKLAARHAPPSSKHRRQSRGSGVAGGLQELYYHSVRRYLTEANMTDEASEKAAGAGDEAKPPPQSLHLLLTSTSSSPGPEGSVLHAKVLELQGQPPRSIDLGVGASLRLLLHRSHPLLQGRSGTDPIDPGALLRLNGCRILADASQACGGPLLLPLKASWLKRDATQYPYSEVHESRLPTDRARSIPTPFSGVRRAEVPIPVWECLDDEAMGCSPVPAGPIPPS